jgi:hypothetical protein
VRGRVETSYVSAWFVQNQEGILVDACMEDGQLLHKLKDYGPFGSAFLKKIICVFKPNHNFGVFGIAILKT